MVQIFRIGSASGCMSPRGEKVPKWYGDLAESLLACLKNFLTIGIYEGHVFVIKDIARLAKNYACANCRARFTQDCNRKRHFQTCRQGKTVIDCPGEKAKAPQTAFEKSFYPKHNASKQTLRWLEREAKRMKIHIHHAMCGQGGERGIERAPVDGYNHATKTVFQYHGCHWHGCRKCFPHDRDKIVYGNNKTREDRYEATMTRTRFLQKAGYQVIEAGACQVGKIDAEPPRAEIKSYPHSILYDFEAYGDNNHRKESTPTLTIENAHVPISENVGDTLEREPTNICERDPAELVRKFMEELRNAEKTSGPRYERSLCQKTSCRRAQLGQLRPESDQKPLRRPPC